jgi:hypothetical protein
VPGKYGLVSGEVYLAIGKTLAGVNVGATSLQVFPTNLLRAGGGTNAYDSRKN